MTDSCSYYRLVPNVALSPVNTRLVYGYNT